MAPSFTACLLVGAGGLFGSVSRYGLSLAGQRLAFDWPAGTLAANALGCFLVAVIAEIVDGEEKINAFLPRLHDLFEESGRGGLITLEKVQIIRYLKGQNS